MGTKNNPGDYDCYANALPDEPMFILLARDRTAPDLLRVWAHQLDIAIDLGDKPESDREKVTEAILCANQMEEWREANDGAWRQPGGSDD